MESDWFETTIGEQITLQRGFDITKANQRPGVIPVVSSAGISSFHDTATVMGPGVVLGRKGVVGSVFYIDVDFWAHDTALWVKDFHGNNPRFVFYFFRSIASHLASLDVGSANPTLNRNHVHPIPIVWTNRAEQDEIVETLGVLDDRITLLRETNATLEAIAQALFKSWFVDFDPVRAKAEDRDPEGVPPEVVYLFPSEFIESELGAFPKGWSWRTLEHYSELNPETWSNKSHPESLLYVDLANTKENQIDSVAEFAFEDAPSRARRVLRHGDTIVGTVRPGNKSFAFIQDPPAALTGSTGFAVLRPRKGYFAEFIFLAATRKESIECLANLADGGAYPAVRPEVVHQIVSISCPDQIAQSFHQLVFPLFRRLAANNLEAASLADLRDTLLPRLMTGKIRVPDVEEIMA